jgi:acyl-CoA synthetase (AMP-forming)/AMP-acid ligase II
MDFQDTLDADVPFVDSSDTENYTDVVNVSTFLTEAAQISPYRRAVVYPASRDKFGRVAYAHLTFLQLDQESDRLARGLSTAGISRGVRTILMVPPGPEFFILTFALFKAGAVPVVVDPGMGIDRMLQCLSESRARGFIGIPKAHMLRLFSRRHFSSVRTWVTVGKRWFWGGYTLNGLASRAWEPFSVAKTKAEEIAAVLFTTGSTGPAKGAIYTHGNFDAQIRQIGSHFQISPDEIDLPTFPLFALFDPALGMTAVIPDMDPTRPAKANPERIIEAIFDHGVTNMFASPALLNRLGRYGEKHGIKLPSLKRVVSAGAPVSADNIERFSKMLTDSAEVHTPYGATEAVPVVSITSGEILSETRLLSEKGFGVCIGRPLDATEVQLIQVTDNPIPEWSEDLVVPAGEIGEITVKGELVTRGYFERPKDDSLAKIRDGDSIRHRMGDLGWLDKAGRIWFCGRKSQRVITKQGTLFTIPCETIFNLHPSVYRSALVGVGKRLNQVPVICIELEKHQKKDPKEIVRELLNMAVSNPQTEDIKIILFHKDFPVDIRHNSKIFREKLSDWAEKQIQEKKEKPIEAVK